MYVLSQKCLKIIVDFVPVWWKKWEQISFVNWIVVIWSHCTFIHMIVGKSSKLPNDMLKALEDFSVIAKYKSLQKLFLNRHFPKCLNWNKEHPYFECMKFDRHTVKIKQIKMQRCILMGWQVFNSVWSVSKQDLWLKAWCDLKCLHQSRRRRCFCHHFQSHQM